MNKENDFASSAQEKYFLDTFPLIHKIASQKLRISHPEEVEDITQKVKLGLWLWKRKRPADEYTQEEWLKIANTAVNNEIKTFFAECSRRANRLSPIDENETSRLFAENLPKIKLEGNTKMELYSLLLDLWRIIQNQSLIEHYALLFKKADLLVHLISYKCCPIREMAIKLKLSEEELDRIIRKLPFTDGEIVSLLKTAHNLNVTPQAIRKSRQRAAAKLRSAINETSHNRKSPAAGKTRIASQGKIKRR